MMLLPAGSHQRMVDRKRRVVLPAPLRPVLGRRVVMVRSGDGLLVYSAEAWSDLPEPTRRVLTPLAEERRAATAVWRVQLGYELALHVGAWPGTTLEWTHTGEGVARLRRVR